MSATQRLLNICERIWSSFNSGFYVVKHLLLKHNSRESTAQRQQQLPQREYIFRFATRQKAAKGETSMKAPGEAARLRDALKHWGN